MLQLIRAGTKPEEILLVCPSIERQRAQLETALCALEVPYAIEGRMRIGKTAFGQALLSFLRFEWLAGGRHDLYGFLRSPFSGLTRAHVDYLEGRLRGRGVSDPTRVVEETLKLRGQPLRDARRVPGRARPSGGGSRSRPLDGAASRTASTRRPSVPARSSTCARIEPSTTCWDELRAWVDLGGALSREELYGALDRAMLRLARGDEPCRVAVTDLLRANASNRGRSPLGWRRGASPAASRARPSSPTRSAGPSTRHPAARG